MKTARMLVILVLALVVGLPAGVADADYTFGTPTNLGPTVNSSAWDVDPCISTDGLEFYFASNRPGGSGRHDLWVTTRATTNDPWEEPVNLGPTVNTSSHDFTPGISTDGLMLFFASRRPGGSGSYDLWVTTRTTTDADWSAPENLGATVNSSAEEIFPSISADGLQLYFSEWEVSRPGGYGGSDMWVTTRDTASDPWGTPVNLGPTVNSLAHDDAPFITADGLALFFSSTRPGTYGSVDIFVTRRATTDDDWDTPVNLGPTVNNSDGSEAPRISADGSTLYFMSNRPGGVGNFDIWQAPIIPIVDFNGDGIVDALDICIMADHWHTDYQLCDIGPMPWGDGIVDVQDLIVLAEHLFTYPGAVAYWKLDETEGSIAHDSIGDCNGVLYGGPIWEPNDGIIDGALRLDGVGDYVSTPFVLNPVDGAFSVFAWIKGGAPGQAVLSQIGGVNWLCADSSEGNLMSELRYIGGRTDQPPLSSQTLITDDAWHRVGFVWDGSQRTLYVDGVAVAEDTQTNLDASENGLYIGAGSNLEPGALWSGLIDDVRIYNRAVTP